jgi:hypothetical protein
MAPTTPEIFRHRFVLVIAEDTTTTTTTTMVMIMMILACYVALIS